MEESKYQNDDFNIKSQIQTSKQTLWNRAKAKYFTFSLILPLMRLNSSLFKSYRNTFYCTHNLSKIGNKVTSKYCKNRWCLVCNRIRTAVLIYQYGDIIKSWEDKHFLTLTIPNVPEELLEETIKEMNENFKRIKWVLEKRFKNQFKIEMIRKLEVTYNPIRNDYHPHYHLICCNKRLAEAIKEEWLRRYSEAKDYLQDIVPADDNSVMELFKYFTKVITSVKGKKIDVNVVEPNKRRGIYIRALDVIFRAVHNKRTFQVYGMQSKVKEEDIDLETVELEEIANKIEVYQWVQEVSDWVNVDTGEGMTDYTPSDEIYEILGNIVE